MLGFTILYVGLRWGMDMISIHSFIRFDRVLVSPTSFGFPSTICVENSRHWEIDWGSPNERCHDILRCIFHSINFRR
jgi:hypothetical protein